MLKEFPQQEKPWPKEEINEAVEILSDMKLKNAESEELTQKLKELGIDTRLYDHIIAMATDTANKKRAEKLTEENDKIANERKNERDAKREQKDIMEKITRL